MLDGSRHTLKGSIVINAAGPWVDVVLGDGHANERRHIGGAKGSHLIVNPFPGAPKDVVYYESRADGRLVLVIPWGDRYMIGTTDKKFEEDPDTAKADQSEMEYLLGEVNQLIPGANLTPTDVVYTYSGVRPLPYVPAQSEWKVPRSHVIHDHAPVHPGLLSIIGGKLTTYRSLAEETVDHVFRMLGKKAPACTTRSVLFPGARIADAAQFARDLKLSFSVDPAIIDRLVSIYGSRAADVLELGREDASLLSVFDPDSGAIGAELVFTFEHEFCRTLTDALIRRIMVGLNGSCGRDVLDSAADLLARRLGWSDARKQTEIDGYLSYITRFAVPSRNAPNPSLSQTTAAVQAG
jgi:glycerol-3-phosphate dehydrogenase